MKQGKDPGGLGRAALCPHQGSSRNPEFRRHGQREQWLWPEGQGKTDTFERYEKIRGGRILQLY